MAMRDGVHLVVAGFIDMAQEAQELSEPRIARITAVSARLLHHHQIVWLAFNNFVMHMSKEQRSECPRDADFGHNDGPISSYPPPCRGMMHNGRAQLSRKSYGNMRRLYVADTNMADTFTAVNGAEFQVTQTREHSSKTKFHLLLPPLLINARLIL